MAFPVVLDACVLLPMPVCDLILRIADAKEYRAHWSEDILVELERNLVQKLNVSPAKAARRIEIMKNHFPDAEITN